MQYTKTILSLIFLITLLLPESLAYSFAPPAKGEQDPGQPVAGTKTLFLPMLTRMSSPSVFGVEMHNTDTIDLMAQSGSSWVRRNGVFWDEVEAIRGQRDWSVLAELEQEMIDLSQKGVQIVMIVRNTPTWARIVPESFCSAIKPEALWDFASFMHELVARYSKPPYHVKYWEIGNEPDVLPHTDPNFPFGCWGDASDSFFGGGYYAEALKQVYPQIKAVDPEAQVLLGGLLMDCDPRNPPENPPGSGQYKDCTSSKFLEGILINGGANYFDGVSFHAYDFYYGTSGAYGNPNWHSGWNSTGPTLEAKIGFIHEVLARYGASQKFLMATEIALVCSGKCDESFEKTKANELVQAYSIGIIHGLRATIWYDLWGGWRNTALLYDDTSPRPAYLAFKFLRSKLGNATYVREVSQNGIKGYEFRNLNQRIIWVLWSQDGKSRSYSLPSLPSAAYDTLGSRLAPSHVVNVDHRPIFLEWPPQ